MAKPARGRPASPSGSSSRSRSRSRSRSFSGSGSSSRSRSRSRSRSFSSSSSPRSGSSRSPSPAPRRKSPVGGARRGRSPPSQAKKSSPPPRISRNVNENHLKEIFVWDTEAGELVSIHEKGNFGEVVNVRLAIDHVVNLPKGFAYVEFKNRADAEKAQLYMDGAQVDGFVRAKFTLPERKKVSSPPKAAATSSRRDVPKSDDAALDADKDAPKRPREGYTHLLSVVNKSSLCLPFHMHDCFNKTFWVSSGSPGRKPLSPPRRRSPVVRRGSPRRESGSPAPRRRVDSPVRRRADSPYRRGDSPPPRRRPASPPRGRSPSSPPRRFRSPPRASPRRIRGSPVRRRSPLPPRRRCALLNTTMNSASCCIFTLVNSLLVVLQGVLEVLLEGLQLDVGVVAPPLGGQLVLDLDPCLREGATEGLAEPQS
ncbi:UNVERIFIED_CONTAM: Serine/arginine-rich splicing factor [Sesamum radiatum]|uniref:Serine/arginine-rich splicing factor n=1 Tax=Sesamum radiatum TaxID=300843 RepID=A0AAW2K235_SESRA